MAQPIFSKKHREQYSRANVIIDNMLKISDKDAIVPCGASLKMMQKMGWNPGDGLGANKQGMAVPIQIKRNINSRGLGFSRKIGSELEQHGIAFEKFQNVLSVLNEEAKKQESKKKKKPVEDVTVKKEESSWSLEAASKKLKGRGRIHYQKYTRGKDLSRYSAEEMACVLGSKAFSLIKDDKKEMSSENSSRSMTPKLNSEGSSDDDSLSEEEVARPSFGNGTTKQSSDEPKGNGFSFYSNFQSAGFINEKSDSDSSDEEEKTESVLASSLMNKFRFNYMSAFVKSENTLNDDSSIKIKEELSEPTEDVACTEIKVEMPEIKEEMPEIKEEMSEIKLEEDENISKKKKKKKCKKDKKSKDNALESIESEGQTSPLVQKKSKKNEPTDETIQEAGLENGNNSKKKKKSKKHLTEDDSIVTVKEETQTPKKKKKKSKDAFPDSLPDEVETENVDHTIKKKKKKRKREEVEIECDSKKKKSKKNVI